MLLQATRPVWQPGELTAAAVRLSSGMAIAFVVYHLVRRVPWPRPFRLRFAALHLVAAPLAGLAWYALSTALEALVPDWESDLTGPRRVIEMVMIGSFFYALVIGISYAAEGAARAARAEALAARTQLAALRAQVQPHFLFNALHTVVQLIPIEPARAADAAEQVAALLRATLEDDRDVVSLHDEWTFVSRYLALERLRFGDRLRVHAEIDPALLDARVPSFAVQTLVENAVRHGAAPRIAPTDVTVSATRSATALTLRVHDTGDGPSRAQRAADATGGGNGGGDGGGTGLARLRDRLAVLYGDRSRLTTAPGPAGGFDAVLVIPYTESPT